MKPRFVLLVVLAAVAALGAVALTFYVGSGVREETLVAQPYEAGLRQAERKAAAARLGWTVDVAPAARGRPLGFALRARDGAPVEGAAVKVVASLPGSGHGQVEAVARPAGGPGRYEADLTIPGDGAWDVRFEISRGGDEVHVTRRIGVGAAAAAPPGPGPEARGPCDLAATPCTVALSGGGSITLDLGPRPLRAMQELAVTAAVRGEGLEGAAVRVRFDMRGMTMFPVEAALAPSGAPGRTAGRAVLVRCASGRKDWTAHAAVSPAGGGPERTAELDFRLVE